MHPGGLSRRSGLLLVRGARKELSITSHSTVTRLPLLRGAGVGVPDGAQEERDASGVLLDNEEEGLVEVENREGAEHGDAGGGRCLYPVLRKLQGGSVLDTGDHEGTLCYGVEIWGREQLAKACKEREGSEGSAKGEAAGFSREKAAVSQDGAGAEHQQRL